MDKVLIDIRGYCDSVKKCFKNKDIISLKELLSAFEDLIFDNEELNGKIRKLENKDFEEYDNYDEY